MTSGQGGTWAPLTSLGPILDRAEAAVTEGKPLTGTGFWTAVDAARRDRRVAERYADRIAAIDRRSFEDRVRLLARTPSRFNPRAGLMLSVTRQA